LKVRSQDKRPQPRDFEKTGLATSRFPNFLIRRRTTGVVAAQAKARASMEEALPDPTNRNSPAQQPASLERGKRRLLIRRFWSTAIGFWGRHGQPTAWFLSAAVLTIILFNLAMLYAINLWNRKIFDGLQNHDAAAVLFLSLIYFPLLAASVASTVTQVYVRMTLQRRWRHGSMID
jgi:vitamin B12/bleomycin/antimicrobial peptide transport system ATP-binding/permease protein